MPQLHGPTGGGRVPHKMTGGEMYAYIRGIVSDIAADRAVLEAAGVGYELFASRKTLDKLILGEEIYSRDR